MCTATDLLLGQCGEPALDLIEPGCRSRGEVRMKPRTTSQPSAHSGCLVRPIVVHHQMDVQLGWNGFLDGSQELEKLSATMTPMRLTDDLARGDIECCKQRG